MRKIEASREKDMKSNPQFAKIARPHTFKISGSLSIAPSF